MHSFLRPLIVLGGLSFALLPLNPLAGQNVPVVELVAGQDPLHPGLVYFEIPEAFADAELFSLEAGDGSENVFAQRWDETHAVFILEEAMPAGAMRSYELGVVEGAPVRVELVRNESRIHLRDGRRPLMTYHIQTMHPPAGSPAYYRRSGFIHPVYSPGGTVLTDDFPVGHTHQHALFMAWVNTTFHGDDTDFWNQQDETGTVEHRRVLSSTEGPVFARFEVEHAYVSREHGDALREVWTVTAYPIGEVTFFDIRSDQRTAGQEPLILNEYHYGGIGYRGNAAWNAEDSANYQAPMRVLTSLGDHRAAANHTRPRWTAAYGPVGDEEGGLAILDHPSNFRHPQPVRVHPEMPYFCLAPMVEGAFTIAPGEAYSSSYRFVVFDGEPDADLLDGMWAAYADPATATVR